MIFRVGIIVVLLALVTFGRFLISPPSLVEWFSSEEFSDELQEFLAEPVNIAGRSYIAAKVHSTYPFSHKTGGICPG